MGADSPLLTAVLKSEPFVSGHYDTGVLDSVPFQVKPELSESAQQQSSWVAALSFDEGLAGNAHVEETADGHNEINLWRTLGRRAALDRRMG